MRMCHTENERLSDLLHAYNSLLFVFNNKKTGV